jgi:MFS family permease
VGVLFLANGAFIAKVLPRLPAIRDQLDLSNAALGAAVGAGPLGGLVAGLLAGALVGRIGAARLALITAGIYGALLGLIGLAPGWLVLAGTMFAIGATDAVMDVAQNAVGIDVQRRYGRSIMQGLHGMWSAGTLLGGAVGAVAGLLGIPVVLHLTVVGLTLAGLTLLAVRWSGLQGVRAAGPELIAAPPPWRHLARTLRASLAALLPLAGLTVLTAFVEEAPATWSAIFIADETVLSAAGAGIGYVAYTGGMTAGRFMGDGLVDRWGAGRVARAGSALAGLGILIAILSATQLGGNPILVLLGFVLAGIGIAPMFPALFLAAGSHHEVRPGDGIAIVSWSSRSAMFAGPAVIGVTSDLAGLPLALALPVAGAVLLALAATRILPGRHPSS